MRNKVALLLGLSLVLAFSISLMADHHQHTGWITDAKCGAGGKYDAAHKACALNQALAKEHIGHEVVVEGAAKDDSIAVTKIEAKK